ncbi:MAG TPA: hypothetical protein P5186_06375 [Candidatus Paceibacterota bacterium]|nr:hypothetical protein [Candidatus Paceibacterota bacterium]
MLIGFLVGGKVLDRSRNENSDAYAYALDRASRIWLPLCPALLLSAAVGSLLELPLSLGGFFGNLFGLQGVLCWSYGGNFPLWSLAYEMWFYFLAGCAAVATSSRPTNSRLWGFIGVVVCSMVFTRLDATFLFCWLLGAISYSQLSYET